MNLHRRYLLVSPCRDESEHMRRTLDSVAAQSVLPALWVVVDDGSSDSTPTILEDYARKLPFLRWVRREDRGCRCVGPGVVEAFYFGLGSVKLDEFDYLCKLDMDLDLPPRYFELLMVRMEREPRLGTTSGKPWFINPITGRLLPEVCGDEMSVGPSKFYRVRCFQEIGGFVRQIMWDGIDCHRARMCGWIAESVEAENLRFLHLRPMGSSQDGGIWAGRVRMGFGQYFMGSSPLYVAASAAYRLFKYPVFYGSFAMLWGFFSSALKRVPRYECPEFRRFVRRYQRVCLLMGKTTATRKVTAEQGYAWHADHGECADGTGLKPRVRAEVLGLPFDLATMEASLERCLAWCQGPRISHTVITAHAALLCMMRRDPELRQACLAGDLILADGVSVVWTSRMLGMPLPARVAGVDLMARLLAAGSQNELKVYFLGARQEVVERLVSRCAKDFPRLQVVGYRDGYFSADEHPDIVRQIRARSPDLLFVGMPCGFRETWCERHRVTLNVPVIMGVGGSFDVLAGLIPRAPVWLQSAGMEWSWRLVKEPRRMWKRYLTTNVQFLWLVARELTAGRKRVPPKGDS